MNILPSNSAIGFTEPFSTSRVGPGDLHSVLWRRKTGPLASFRLLPLLSEVGGCCSLFMEKQASLEFAICSSESCHVAAWFLCAGLLADAFLVTTNEYLPSRLPQAEEGKASFCLEFPLPCLPMTMVL